MLPYFYNLDQDPKQLTVCLVPLKTEDLETVYSMPSIIHIKSHHNEQASGYSAFLLQNASSVSTFLKVCHVGTKKVNQDYKAFFRSISNMIFKTLKAEEI
mmetsp:Transcript_27844/g.42964  ORF Transcript_27844/g.42964 Transcript_27844/m.42964 type:complete len:100 (+) Transcript_27844:102-401(+)